MRLTFCILLLLLIVAITDSLPRGRPHRRFRPQIHRVSRHRGRVRGRADYGPSPRRPNRYKPPQKSRITYPSKGYEVVPTPYPIIFVYEQKQSGYGASTPQGSYGAPPPSGGYGGPPPPSGGYGGPPPPSGGYGGPPPPSGGYEGPPPPSGGYEEPPPLPSGGYEEPGGPALPSLPPQDNFHVSQEACDSCSRTPWVPLNGPADTSLNVINTVPAPDLGLGQQKGFRFEEQPQPLVPNIQPQFNVQPQPDIQPQFNVQQQINVQPQPNTPLDVQLPQAGYEIPETNVIGGPQPQFPGPTVQQPNFGEQEIDIRNLQQNIAPARPPDPLCASRENGVPFTPDGCNRCLCMMGMPACTIRACPSSPIQTSDGACRDGHLKLEGCRLCVCVGGEWTNCDDRGCENLPSPPDAPQPPLIKPEPTLSCRDGERLEKGCEVCTCINGDFTDCDRSGCNRGDIPVEEDLLPGIPANGGFQQDNFVQDNFQQDNFVPDNFQQDFQQDNFQQDNFQQNFQQDNFQQNSFVPDNFQQDNFQQDNFQQDNFQQDIFQQDNFQQDNFQQDNFQQDNFQQDNFQQDNFQQDNFQQNNFQQNNFQQDNFQPDNFQQDNFQQDNFQQDNFQQDNFQPDNFQQDNFQQDNFQQDNFQQDNFQQDNFQQSADGYDKSDGPQETLNIIQLNGDQASFNQQDSFQQNQPQQTNFAVQQQGSFDQQQNFNQNNLPVSVGPQETLNIVPQQPVQQQPGFNQQQSFSGNQNFVQNQQQQQQGGFFQQPEVPLQPDEFFNRQQNAFNQIQQNFNEHDTFNQQPDFNQVQTFNQQPFFNQETSGFNVQQQEQAQFGQQQQQGYNYQEPSVPFTEQRPTAPVIQETHPAPVDVQRECQDGEQFNEFCNICLCVNGRYECTENICDVAGPGSNEFDTKSTPQLQISEGSPTVMEMESSNPQPVATGLASNELDLDLVTNPVDDLTLQDLANIELSKEGINNDIGVGDSFQPTPPADLYFTLTPVSVTTPKIDETTTTAPSRPVRRRKKIVKIIRRPKTPPPPQRVSSNDDVISGSLLLSEGIRESRPRPSVQVDQEPVSIDFVRQFPEVAAPEGGDIDEDELQEIQSAFIELKRLPDQ